VTHFGDWQPFYEQCPLKDNTGVELNPVRRDLRLGPVKLLRTSQAMVPVGD
jgi:hypothetical protein